jgi:hypothetical protein
VLNLFGSRLVAFGGVKVSLGITDFVISGLIVEKVGQKASSKK